MLYSRCAEQLHQADQLKMSFLVEPLSNSLTTFLVPPPLARISTLQENANPRVARKAMTLNQPLGL
jgi:hypothetical protein